MEVEEIATLLQSQGKTVSVAEADTCGLIGYLLSTVPGASRYFPGGVIAYSNSVKRKVLGLPEEVLARAGSVSKDVALEMARRVRELIDTDVGVSCTGIAGPTGGTPQMPIGLFYIALAARNGTELWEEVRFQENRDGNKRQTAQAVLDLLGRHLQDR